MSSKLTTHSDDMPAGNRSKCTNSNAVHAVRRLLVERYILGPMEVVARFFPKLKMLEVIPSPTNTSQDVAKSQKRVVDVTIISSSTPCTPILTVSAQKHLADTSRCKITNSSINHHNTKAANSSQELLPYHQQHFAQEKKTKLKQHVRKSMHFFPLGLFLASLLA